MGEIENPDGVGMVGDPTAAISSRSSSRVEHETLTRVMYKVRGCPAAVAACSMMSELATGMTVDEAYELDDIDIMHALGGLPESQATLLEPRGHGAARGHQ